MIKVVLKYVLLTSLIGSLVIGFGALIVVETYYWQLKDVLGSILIILTSITFISAGVMIFLSLKRFNKENQL